MPPKMAPATPEGHSRRLDWASYLPFLGWMRHYRRQDLAGDLIAGLVVTVMLVPQSMAYALLVGLPPQMGLYASIAPLIIYGLLGTSRTLSVGPAAIVALLVASGVGQLVSESSDQYLVLVLLLTFMVGCLQLLLGLARLGFLVNFLSHPVITGFTSAAALVIIFSQLQHLLGIKPPEGDAPYHSLLNVLQQITKVNLITLALGFGSMAILLYSKVALRRHLGRLPVPLPLLEGHSPGRASGSDRGGHAAGLGSGTASAGQRQRDRAGSRWVALPDGASIGLGKPQGFVAYGSRHQPHWIYRECCGS
jgi:hypothetical protein